MIITQAKKAEYKATLDYAPSTDLNDESPEHIHVLLSDNEATEGSSSLDD